MKKVPSVSVVVEDNRVTIYRESKIGHRIIEEVVTVTFGRPEKDMPKAVVNVNEL